MLLLNGRPVTAKQVLTACMHEPASERVKAFCALEAKVMGPCNLEVLQHEYAMVPNTRAAQDGKTDGEAVSLEHVYSLDATTCAVVVARSPQWTFLAHVDSIEAAEEVPELLATVEQPERWSVSLVGGFCETEALEAVVPHALLTALQHSKLCAPAELDLVLVGELNTDRSTKHSQPKYFGCGVELATGAVVPVTLVDRASTPLRAYRSTRLFNDDGLGSVFDHAAYTVCIPPIRLAAVDAADLKQFLRMSDRELLANTSTSPYSEPAYFCEDMRAKLQWLLDNPGWTDLHKRDQVYTLSSSGWMPHARKVQQQ